MGPVGSLQQLCERYLRLLRIAPMIVFVKALYCIDFNRCIFVDVFFPPGQPFH